MEAVGLGAGAISLGIQLIQSLDTFVQNYRHAPTEIVAFQEELKRHKSNLEKARRVLALRAKDSEQHDGESDPWAKQCEAEIDKVLNTLNLPEKSWKKVPARLKQAMRSDNLRKAIAQLHRYCEQVLEQVAIESFEDQITSQRHLQQLSSFNLNQRRTNILNWLTPHRHSGRQKDLLRQFQQGTLGWVFEQDEFLNWQIGSRTVQGDEETTTQGSPATEDYPDGRVPPILWYYGGPGTGKSVIMSQVVKALEDRAPDDVAILYLYCNYAYSGTQTLNGLLLSLVRQAAERLTQTKRFPELLDKQFQLNGDGIPHNLETEEIQKMFEELVAEFRHCTVLIDGLDEYIHSQGESKLNKPNELLETVVESTERLGDKCRLLVTSRENVVALHPKLNAVKVMVEANEADVRTFVEAHIRNSKFEHSDAVLADPSLQALITDKVVLKADKQFLLATMHVKDLDDQRSVRDLEDALDSLPVSSHDRYLTSMKRVTAQPNMPGREYSLGFLIIGYIFHACRAFSTHELQQALAIRETDSVFVRKGVINLKTIISHGMGLLRITEEETVEFVHASFYEFLQTKPEFTIALQKIHQTLTQTCMTFMSLEDFAEPVDSSAERYSEHPFLPYAAQFFGVHATACLKKRSQLLPGYIDFIQHRIKLGALQVFAAKVLQMPGSSRIRKWKENLTDMHLAIVIGLVPAIKYLLDNGADIEEAAYKEETPLHMAARASNKEAVKLLLKLEADIHKTNYSGKNALDMIMTAPYLRIELKLVDEIFRDRILALLYQPIEDVVKARTDVEAKIRQKAATLDEAHESKENMNAEGFFKITILEIVLATNLEMDLSDTQAEIALLLIESGIELNSEGPAQGTPLQLAIIYRRKDLVQGLLQKGANIWVDFGLGYNALELAKQRKDADGGTEKAAEILDLVVSKAKELEKLENSEPDGNIKLLIAGPAQASYIVEQTRLKNQDRFDKMFSYTSKVQQQNLEMRPADTLQDVFSDIHKILINTGKGLQALSSDLAVDSSDPAPPSTPLRLPRE